MSDETSGKLRVVEESVRGRSAPERGSVTAEAAVVLPIVAAFALALVWMVAVGVAQIQVVDAARDAARSLARGDDLESAVAAAHRAAPSHADIDVSFAGDTVHVSVTSEQDGPGWLLVPLPALTVHAESTVEVEGDGTGRR
ncbi:MAG: pilus assembly protein [Propionibacteriales bacterium]|nr:pilus assembly protein [Propionibacteriales bacterium]